MTTVRTLTLASRSPQRRAILTQLGVDFRVEVPAVEETEEGVPRDLVLENARRKAEAGAGALVLGVDTTVALEGRSYGKPDSREEARATLGALGGREHEVWSAIALRDGGRLATATSRTRVRFRTLRADELDWYVSTEEWRGRAGGYAIQARGAALVESIDGDFWNVVGLPVAALMGLAPQLVVSA
ncbi:MAG: Septum formation protein Maf [uncultured Solirubrobacterales bacterium]|uniref:Nucleoside triphosphate pyrophosphatase n=1 Tax=uncultured Solirubrobacterales bacterium TaxID=768556 RepID=A0A6J4S8A5_9ACTN|nr:MAG: Septum formation protein Maf [uncultured Solirubrobacterales bacterium]